MHKELARAKINLTLHVGQVVTDEHHSYFGYHPLTSLVVFSNFGDQVTSEKSAETSLTVSGPFADGVPVDDSNLMLKAYHAVKARTAIPPLKFHLTKNLPIASGIGGGSADAAAVLRILKNYAGFSDDTWREIALELGADVPVCLVSRTSLMSGIGEIVEPIDGLGQLAAILVNPGVQVSTGQIFMSFDDDIQRTDLGQPTGGLMDRFKAGRNDLQIIAEKMSPKIRDCLNALGGDSQMSGSGATCFGLYTDMAMANLAAQSLKSQYPDFWVKPVMLGDEE